MSFCFLVLLDGGVAELGKRKTVPILVFIFFNIDVISVHEAGFSFLKEIGIYSDNFCF